MEGEKGFRKEIYDRLEILLSSEDRDSQCKSEFTNISGAFLKGICYLNKLKNMSTKDEVTNQDAFDINQDLIQRILVVQMTKDDP